MTDGKKVPVPEVGRFTFQLLAGALTTLAIASGIRSAAMLALSPLAVVVVLLRAGDPRIGLFKPTDCALRVKAVLS